MTARFLLLWFAVPAWLGLGAAACAGTPATTPRIRVARDFGCAVEQTSFQKIEEAEQPGYARWQLEGCGRTAVYLCTTPVRDCWREGSAPP